MDEIFEEKRRREVEALTDVKEHLVFRGSYFNAKEDSELEEIAYRNKIAKGELIRTMVVFGNQVLAKMEREGKLITNDSFRQELEQLLKKE